MGILKRLLGDRKKRKKAKGLEEIHSMFERAKTNYIRLFTELLSDPDIEIRKDFSQHLLTVVLPIVKSQKKSYERDNAIEKLTVLAKEMRAPADEHEKIALNSAAFYYTLDMLKKGTPPEG